MWNEGVVATWQLMTIEKEEGDLRRSIAKNYFCNGICAENACVFTAKLFFAENACAFTTKLFLQWIFCRKFTHIYCKIIFAEK